MKTITQPDLSVTIHDQFGAPVRDAKLVLETGYHPHGQHLEYVALTSDVEGKAVFSEISKQEWNMPLWLHGVRFYYWNWCVAKAGFATKSGRLSDLELDQKSLNIVLTPLTSASESYTCRVK